MGTGWGVSSRTSRNRRDIKDSTRTAHPRRFGGNRRRPRRHWRRQRSRRSLRHRRDPIRSLPCRCRLRFQVGKAAQHQAGIRRSTTPDKARSGKVCNFSEARSSNGWLGARIVIWSPCPCLTSALAGAYSKAAIAGLWAARASAKAPGSGVVASSTVRLHSWWDLSGICSIGLPRCGQE